MFRKMRRFKQQLPENEAIEILENSDSGVLALLGDDDYPYTVPTSYIYADGKLYFHSAPAGHKVEAIRKNEKASFCIIEKDEVMPEKYTTLFRSVVAFGKVRIIEDKDEMRRIAESIAMKYSAAFKEGIPGAIDEAINRMAIIEMTIEHLTGKEGVELMKQRNK